jgi:hypothetical protein
VVDHFYYIHNENTCTMARIAGVTTKKDTRGTITHVSINAKKHPDAIVKLKEMGLIEKSPLQKEVEENPANFMTVEEMEKRLLQKIDAL